MSQNCGGDGGYGSGDSGYSKAVAGVMQGTAQSIARYHTQGHVGIGARPSPASTVQGNRDIEVI
jgi:hypothetical protein